MARIAASGRVASTRVNTVLYNGDFELKPAYVADTNTAGRWIDGTAAGSVAKLSYGWAIPPAAIGNAGAAFDTTVFRSGAASLKMSLLTGAGFITGSSYRQVPSATLLGELFRLSPNTQYTLTGYIRTNNVMANGAYIDVREYGSTGTVLVTTSTNKLSGTDTSFRVVSVTITTNASTTFGSILLRLNVPGNICDAYFDDVGLVPSIIGRAAS